MKIFKLLLSLVFISCLSQNVLATVKTDIKASRQQVRDACEAAGGTGYGTEAGSGDYGCVTDNAWIACDEGGSCEGEVVSEESDAANASGTSLAYRLKYRHAGSGVSTGSHKHRPLTNQEVMKMRARVRSLRTQKQIRERRQQQIQNGHNNPVIHRSRDMDSSSKTQRKRPGRVKYGATSEARISKKPREIVVVGSKVKDNK